MTKLAVPMGTIRDCMEPDELDVGVRLDLRLAYASSETLMKPLWRLLGLSYIDNIWCLGCLPHICLR